MLTGRNLIPITEYHSRENDYTFESNKYFFDPQGGYMFVKHRDYYRQLKRVNGNTGYHIKPTDRRYSVNVSIKQLRAQLSNTEPPTDTAEIYG